MTNQASEDELERKLMDLFARVAEFGRVFLTSATKEEFAESIRAGALDHQEAAHEAMKLIRTEKLKLLAEVRERVVQSLPDTAFHGTSIRVKDNIRDGGYHDGVRDSRQSTEETLTKLEAEL